jgi:outer membrane beta-barrel protein
MKRIILALAFAVVAICGTEKTVSAQEILLEGPLAGAPAVRKLVQYRELRFSAGPQFAYTLLNDYMHNFLLGARLEFNILDWLGIGAVGYYAFNAPTKLTTYISESEDIGGTETTPTESNWPSYTGARNFEDQVGLLKGMYLLQVSLVPFRGKLAMFEKLFVAVDGYIFLGGGVVHIEDRKNCTGSDCGTWSADDPIPREPERGSRVTGTFTLGVGFMVFFNEFFAVNLEYRIAPFKWNSGGTDEAGQAGDQWVLDENEDDELYWDSQPRGTEGDYPDGDITEEDRTWNANQSIGLGFIFYFPFEPTITD